MTVPEAIVPEVLIVEIDADCIGRLPEAMREYAMVMPCLEHLAAAMVPDRIYRITKEPDYSQELRLPVILIKATVGKEILALAP